MKKIFTLFALFVLSINIAHAQDAAKAKKLLDEVSSKVKSYDNVILDFNEMDKRNKSRV